MGLPATVDNLFMASARILLVEDGKVALIERRWPGMPPYYLFPGGTIERGETAAKAAVRETKEELGLEVSVARLVAKVLFRGNLQDYFLVSRIGGVFGTGQGADTEDASFRPLWLPVAGVSQLPVRPNRVAHLLECSATGWPGSVLEFEDPG
jgi:8-oxo-dGTP diphosphatase